MECRFCISVHQYKHLAIERVHFTCYSEIERDGVVTLNHLLHFFFLVVVLLLCLYFIYRWRKCNGWQVEVFLFTIGRERKVNIAQRNKVFALLYIHM